MAKTNYNKISNKPKEDVKKESKPIVDDLVPEAKPVVEEIPAVIEKTEVKAPEKKSEKKAKTGVVVDCIKLNVRNNPHPEAAIELTIDKGTEVEIVGSNGDFYNVRKGTITEGFSGWCMKKFISVK